MSPPTDELIRDYLTRLSAAARTQLGADDRRALVTRTRDFIERTSGQAGPPTAKEVASLLAGLGDPSGLVQQERQRLAAIRGGIDEPASARSRLARALRRGPGKVIGSSWHWPVQEGSRTDLQLTLLEGGEVAADAHDDGTASAPSAADEAASSGGGGAGRNGTAPEGVFDRPDVDLATVDLAAADASTGEVGAHAARQPSPLVLQQAREPSWFLLALGGEPQAADSNADDVPADDVPADAVPADSRPAHAGPTTGTAGATARASWPSTVARRRVDGMQRSPGSGSGASGASGASQQSSATPAWQLTTPSDPVVPRQVRRALRAVGTWYRRHPLEAAAVTLLGLGGVIFPPIWVLGAALALASSFWDYVDKWIGLALPVVVTIIGVAIGVANGGHVSMGQSVHEGWVYGVAASRIASVLSGCYLGWRTVHGRRPNADPPWNQPHKIG